MPYYSHLPTIDAGLLSDAFLAQTPDISNLEKTHYLFSNHPAAIVQMSNEGSSTGPTAYWPCPACSDP